MMSRLKLKVYMRYSIEYYIFINMVVVGGLVTKSCLTLVTPGTVACQTPLSMGFSRQECWDELPFPSPGALPDPGIEPVSPTLAGRFFTTEPVGKPNVIYHQHFLNYYTRMSSLSLFQGIFPTQGSNPGCPHCRQILYQLSQKKKKRRRSPLNLSFSKK